MWVGCLSDGSIGPPPHVPLLPESMYMSPPFVANHTNSPKHSEPPAKTKFFVQT
jgi:hypothetical protein